MLVKATRLGYYDDRRQKEGSVFKLIDKKKQFFIEEKDKKSGKVIKVKKSEIIKAEKQFSASWMEKVNEDDIDQEVLDHAESVAENSKVSADSNVI